MKKILAILVAIMLLMNMSFVTAFAADDIILSVDFDGDAKTYTVSGFINSTRNRIPVTLYMEHESGDLIAAVDTLVTEKTAQGVKFTFPAVSLNPSTLSGNILVKVATTYLDYKADTTVHYDGVDAFYAALKTVKAAVDSGVEATLKAAIGSTKDVLGVDESALLALTDDPASSSEPASIALRNIFRLDLDLPEGSTDAECYDTEEECAQIAAQVLAYQNQFKEAVVLGGFFDVSSVQDLKDWYDANKAAYGFESDDLGTAIDETILLTDFNEATAKEGYLLRISRINFVNTIAELNIQMKNQAVLQMVEDSNQTVVNRVLTDYDEILTGVYDANGQNPVSVNYSLWESISADQKSTVCLNVAGKDYYDIYEFVNAVNTGINSVVLGGTPVFNTPVSSDRGGNRGGGDKPVAIPVDDTAGTAHVMVFEDIEHVAWADKAIHYLYSNGIIAGRDEKTFDPDNKVTRAELAKMLVVGLGLKGEGTVSFSDVPSSAWYAEYVLVAAANGLILGDDNGRFNPNSPVSRQDAAVMMYRAIGTNEVAEKAYFTDYSSISAYAAPAVNYMCKEGIINGVGDAKFAPLENLTRAQAAKMLYSLLVG